MAHLERSHASPKMAAFWILKVICFPYLLFFLFFELGIIWHRKGSQRNRDM